MTFTPKIGWNWSGLVLNWSWVAWGCLKLVQTANVTSELVSVGPMLTGVLVGSEVIPNSSLGRFSSGSSWSGLNLRVVGLCVLNQWRRR